MICAKYSLQSRVGYRLLTLIRSPLPIHFSQMSQHRTCNLKQLSFLALLLRAIGGSVAARRIVSPVILMRLRGVAHKNLILASSYTLLALGYSVPVAMLLRRDVSLCLFFSLKVALSLTRSLRLSVLMSLSSCNSVKQHVLFTLSQCAHKHVSQFHQRIRLGSSCATKQTSILHGSGASLSVVASRAGRRVSKFLLSNAGVVTTADMVNLQQQVRQEMADVTQQVRNELNETATGMFDMFDDIATASERVTANPAPKPCRVSDLIPRTGKVATTRESSDKYDDSALSVDCSQEQFRAIEASLYQVLHRTTVNQPLRIVQQTQGQRVLEGWHAIVSNSTTSRGHSSTRQTGSRTGAPTLNYEELLISLENIILDKVSTAPTTRHKKIDTSAPMDIGMTAKFGSERSSYQGDQRIMEIAKQTFYKGAGKGNWESGKVSSWTTQWYVDGKGGNDANRGGKNFWQKGEAKDNGKVARETA